MIAMPPYVLLGSSVAIHEGGVWHPRFKWLVSQFFASRVSSLDAILDLLVDCLLDDWFHFSKCRREFAYILHSHENHHLCARRTENENSHSACLHYKSNHAFAPGFFERLEKQA